MRRNLIIDLYNFKSSGGKLICMVSKNVYFLSPFIINIIYIISNMSQNPRKYVTAERSVQKEGYRSSYQGNNTIKTYDSNFYELNKGNSPSYYQNPREERQRIS